MKTFKKIWFLVLLVLLALPMLQTVFHWVDEKPLDGAYVPAKKPVVTLKTLFYEGFVDSLTIQQDSSMTTQDSLMNWCTEQTGFRNTMIRVNNQLLYSVFGKIPVTSLVKGKDGITFFDKSYINSYLGEAFMGKERIQTITRQIKLIQDMLRAKGTTLLPVFVVGKASYFPELIPDTYMAKRHETNNYQEYLKAFEEQGVEMIDFNRWFCERKGTEEYPIYCNLSSHWTVYGASLAMDSLVNFMESKTHRTHIHPFIKHLDSAYLMTQDDELYRMMNLLIPIEHNTIYQPKFGYTQGYMPKVLAISDSYWWAVYAWNVALHDHLFADGGFWFYNRTVYPERPNVQDVTSLNYKQEIEDQEFVLLVCTEATNHLWPYGFVERYLSAYDLVFQYKNPTQYDAADSIYLTYRNDRIEKIIQQIEESPDWLESVTRNAENKGITLEQSLRANADYAYRTSIEPKGFVK